MKKLLTFISVLAVCSALFADITAKKLDDGSVEATFFYGNPRATEVLLAGDFTNWQDGALTMEKGEKGFTLTKKFSAGTTVRYKFIVDGSWTTDLKAPDFIDDGFGGKNSLGDLDAVAGGNASAAAGPKVKFQTWTMIGGQVKGNLNDDNKDIESSGLGAYSYLKFSGDVLPHVPVYFEIAAVEAKDGNNSGFENFYKKDKLKLKDGLKNFGTDLVFDPIYWLSGQHNDEKAVAASNHAYLGHFKVGLSFDYLNWTYGAKYAKLPPHNINEWTTVDKEWEAGYAGSGGYSAFELGQALQELPFGTLTASIIPNRSADRAGNRYGMIAWANLNLGAPASIDFQYNGAYGTDYDTVFDNIMEADYIAGYKGMFSDFTFKVNYLINFYGSIDNGKGAKKRYRPAASDVGVVDEDPDKKIDQMAANGSILYSNEDLGLDVLLGGRFRGAQASMMYVEEGSDNHWNISDQLGDLNRMRVYGDVSYYINDAINVGVAPYLEKTLNTDSKLSFKNKDTMKIYAKPYFSLDFDELLFVPATLEGYVEGYHVTEEDDARDSAMGEKKQTVIQSAGLKYTHKLDTNIAKGFDATFVFDNTNDSYLFNYLYGTVNFVNDYNFQFGCGIRSANNDNKDPTNPFGFFVGMNKKLSVLQKPVFYCQFMYAMDIYNEFNDGPTAYRLDDYKIKGTDNEDNAVERYWENYAVRMGFQWDL
ncbi:glycogen-binding domain-containing protein [uncultured Treponema sp.]|uniref:glycogen-binding domain-containing protein n=1 Tax=uncultured Treponema sp. TaxID=162155 RepID=UPI0025E72DC5|nr:glycogen-binding domain-containing protein [uncultured Treponema sp.]